MPLVAAWLAEAGRTMKNPTAMTLATVDAEDQPSARIIICRGFDLAAGWFAFYTDRQSPKGRHLERRPRASLVFYWDALGRQVRVDGPVTPVPEAEADRYWRTRVLDARHAAIATVQSRPIASRAELLARLEDTVRRVGADAPRPERWVGYRVWAERLEMWVSQPARLHDRAVWTRALDATGDGFKGGAWSATRLEP
jgi:pyridoxamine 5'-phosphate oxidase